MGRDGDGEDPAPGESAGGGGRLASGPGLLGADLVADAQGDPPGGRRVRGRLVGRRARSPGTGRGAAQPPGQGGIGLESGRSRSRWARGASSPRSEVQEAVLVCGRGVRAGGRVGRAHVRASGGVRTGGKRSRGAHGSNPLRESVSRTWRTAACIRDFTVPTGILRIRAISSYFRLSTWARTKTSRCSFPRAAMASARAWPQLRAGPGPRTAPRGPRAGPRTRPRPSPARPGGVGGHGGRPDLAVAVHVDPVVAGDVEQVGDEARARAVLLPHAVDLEQHLLRAVLGQGRVGAQAAEVAEQSRQDPLDERLEGRPGRRRPRAASARCSRPGRCARAMRRGYPWLPAPPQASSTAPLPHGPARSRAGRRPGRRARTAPRRSRTSAPRRSGRGTARDRARRTRRTRCAAGVRRRARAGFASARARGARVRGSGGAGARSARAARAADPGASTCTASRAGSARWTSTPLVSPSATLTTVRAGRP